MTEEPNHRSRETPGGYAVIGAYRSPRAAHEAGLSVLAAGHSYWVSHIEGNYLLLVSAEHAESLCREVEISAALNRYWPPPSMELPLRTIKIWPTAVFVLLIIALFALQNAHPNLQSLGANHSEHVLQDGEWWRIVTAITLHANLGHLAGNILGLSLFAHFACRYMGNGLAWLAITFAAALANLTNALLHAGELYISLGASTAVFAALGILAGFPLGTFLRIRKTVQTRDWLIPFFGGCVLLAWLGGGDFPTDVFAHLWSFGFGLLASIIIALSSLHSKLGLGQQRAMLAVCAAMYSGAWMLALFS